MDENVEITEEVAPAKPKSTVLEKIALILSTIFSPLLVPTYACAVALWITPLSILPEKMRLLVTSVIFFITAIVPMATIIFMIRAGKVSDASISNRKERGVPYIVTGLSYLVAAVYLGTIHAPHWLSFFYAGACFSTLVALLINSAWKISAHATVMGGLVAMFFYIGFSHISMVPMLPWLSVALACSGAVGSARLLLQRHTPGQVYAGFFMGLVIELVFMIL